MADRSAIEWTDATWNPIRGLAPARWLCRKVSPGCDHCYAERLNRRFGGGEYFAAGAGDAAVRDRLWLDENMLAQPLRWKAPRKVFVCSMTDLFGEWVPTEWIDRVFYVMDRAPQHTFQVLTKRARRMRDYCAMRWAPKPNVWLGVSVESQEYVWRLNVLSETPGETRFVSAEPLLGTIDFGPRLEFVDWLIAGGESGGPASRMLVENLHSPCLNTLWRGNAAMGAGLRYCHACGGQLWTPKPLADRWVRSIRDQCQASGVAFLFKQWGGPTPKAGGRLLDSRTWDEYPTAEAALV